MSAAEQRNDGITARRCWSCPNAAKKEIAPFTLLAATSAIPERCKSSRSDALAFIGSDGESRGAQLEQATRHYHPSLMSDQQLAHAIATSFQLPCGLSRNLVGFAIQLSPHICDNARQIPTHIPNLLLSDRVSRLDVAVDACLKAPAATLATH